eukprot:3939708-Pyramimonas_sp.AAC.1
MAIEIVARVALTVSAAVALSIAEGEGLQRKTAHTKTEWPMETDLPRTVLQTNDMNSSGCGREIPGYFTIE